MFGMTVEQPDRRSVIADIAESLLEFCEAGSEVVRRGAGQSGFQKFASVAEPFDADAELMDVWDIAEVGCTRGLAAGCGRAQQVAGHGRQSRLAVGAAPANMLGDSPRAALQTPVQLCAGGLPETSPALVARCGELVGIALGGRSKEIMYQPFTEDVEVSNVARRAADPAEEFADTPDPTRRQKLRKRFEGRIVTADGDAKFVDRLGAGGRFMRGAADQSHGLATSAQEYPARG